MMGLLDMYDDPKTMGLLSLGLRLMSTPGKFGTALGTAGMGALGDIQAAQQRQQMQKQRALQEQLLGEQIAETRAQAKQRDMQAVETQRKLQEQQRIDAILQQAVGSVAPINANTVSGVSGPRPEALSVVGQRKPMDYQSLIAAKVPPELVKALAESGNYGRTKVARTVDVEGPGGAKEVMQFDEYGSPVGKGLPGYVAPVAVNQGDRQTFVKPLPGASLPVFESPDNKASNATRLQAANISAGPSWARLNFDKEKEKQDVGGGIPISDAAIENAAARYNTDGTLPPNLGRGTQGAQLTAKILDRAAMIAAQDGDDAKAQRIRQIANKATSGALLQLSKQEASVGAFERNFLRNADIALELSKSKDTTGMPIVNKWINVGKRTVTGDPVLSAYDAAIKTVVNEYTKILSGAMGNTQMAEGEVKKVESLLNSAQTPAQVEEVIALMKRETANRMTGFTEQKEAMRKSMIPEKKSTAVPSFASEAEAATAAASGRIKKGDKVTIGGVSGTWQ
jgi:hypothetical protein